MRKRHAIDSDVLPLVITMNVCGFHTYASCQGHGFPCNRIAPYIAFYAPLGRVRMLEKRLREDMESSQPALRWGWWITASFDGHYRLGWRLQPAGPHKWLSCYYRRSVRHDFQMLSDLVLSLFQKIQRIENIEINQVCDDKPPDNQGDTSEHMHFLTESFGAKRVR